MGKNSNIEWTDDSANWWWGCEKVSPGCKFCYADVLSHRMGYDVWGGRAPRRLIRGAKDSLLALQRLAITEGRDRLVFLNSMSDFFEKHDGQVIDHQGFPVVDQFNEPVRVMHLRRRAFATMGQCTNLHHIILTKRPENVATMWEPDGSGQYHRPNVFLGVSVESKDYLWRVEELMNSCQALAPVLVISAEPLLGGYDIPKQFLDLGPRGWVIDGGESQHRARPMHPQWARRHRDQCAEAGVPYFFKQWGEHAPAGWPELVTIHRKGMAMLPDGTIVDHRPWGKDCEFMELVGKKAAGRLLDGVEHSAIPLGNRILPKSLQQSAVR